MEASRCPDEEAGNGSARPKRHENTYGRFCIQRTKQAIRHDETKTMIEIIPNWHPVFVHFTVALLSVSLALFVLNLAVKSEQAAVVAKWTLWMGAGISLLTLAAGIYAYNTVAHDTPSHEAMTLHKDLALITLVLLVPVVVWSVVAERKGQELGAAFVILFLLAGGMLASTAWHGGEVVYRYGIGVMSLPKTDKHDHAGHVDKANESGHSDSAHAHDDGHHGEPQVVVMPMDMNMGSMNMSSSGINAMDDDMDMGSMNMSGSPMSSMESTPANAEQRDN